MLKKGASSLLWFQDHTQKYHTRTPLAEWSARCTDLYLTIQSTQKRQTTTPQAGFEAAIPESRRPQTHALDGADNEISRLFPVFIHRGIILHRNLHYGYGL